MGAHPHFLQIPGFLLIWSPVLGVVLHVVLGLELCPL